MYIKGLQITNYRLFKYDNSFILEDLNIPNNSDEGTGLTLLVGENGCGKTSLLDAIALPLLSYKADSFQITDLNDISEKCVIEVFSNSDFEYKGSMPRVTYKGKGFSFTGGLRSTGSSSYLSSLIVSDQKFIRADGETRPEDNKPDIRVSVNNPWSGPRFNKNDVLYLDKNRTYQTRIGTYNSTRFDRLMEDLDYQYIKAEDTPIDLSEIHTQLSEKVENEFLEQAIEKFKEISGIELTLKVLDQLTPHKKASLVQETSSGLNIQLESIGSGYEMIFSLIYSFFMSTQSRKDLIVLIDEPELHLHPKIQREFIQLLLEFSKTAQIVLTTHSPVLVKHLMENEKVKALVLTKEIDEVSISDIGQRKLPYLSANEINYIAFNLATEEYHNELYEGLKDVHGASDGYKTFDNNFFVGLKGEPMDAPWMGNPNEVSKHTFIRNQIHHRTDNGVASYEDLLISIEKIRNFY